MGFTDWLERMAVGSKNPHAKPYDEHGKGFIGLRIFIKEHLSTNNHHDEIIPETGTHGAFVLGAQPTEFSIKKLSGEYPGKEIHIVSLLSTPERLLEGTVADGKETLEINKAKVVYHRDVSWSDHGAIDEETGKIEPVDSMEKYQGKLSEVYFAQGEGKKTFYCHCMAGRSRSFAETLAFLHANSGRIFTVDEFKHEKWDKVWKKIEAQKGSKYVENLKSSLIDNPSFSDIAEFAELQRPTVKPFRKLDGEQAGLIGLMALSKAAKGIRAEPVAAAREIAGETVDQRNKRKAVYAVYKARLYRDARDIGLILKAPLDSAFRDADDKKAQEKNLVAAFNAYQEKGINLLTAMVVPPVGRTVAHEMDEAEFQIYFKELRPSEQARFAILLKKLEDAQPGLNLGWLGGQSSILAAQAAQNAKKLTAGDQVEFLRTFGEVFDPKDKKGKLLGYEDAIKKILKGSKIDRYNPGVQLAELLGVAATRNANANSVHAKDAKKLNDSSYDHFKAKLEAGIAKLSYEEQSKFIVKLNELKAVGQLPKEYNVAQLAKEVIGRYKKRSIFSRMFGNDLSIQQVAFIDSLSTTSSSPPSYDEVMAARARKELPISTSQPRGSLKKMGEENPYGKLSDVSREGPVGTIYGQWPGAEQAQQSQYRKLPLRLTAKTEQSHYAHLPSWLGGKKVAPTSDKQKKQEQEKGPAPRAP